VLGLLDRTAAHLRVIRYVFSLRLDDLRSSLLRLSQFVRKFLPRHSS